MKHVLVLNSSAAGADSVSRVLVAEAVSRALAAHPDARVTHRDLGANPLPHLVPETLNGVRGTPVTPAEQAARVLSDELVNELRAADTVIIGAPMYNFSVPTTLRAWFDHVLRSGVAFRYSAEGPQGLLGGRRVIVIESRGGRYSEGAAQSVGFQEPYLRHLLGFMGITDVTFVHAEKIGYGPEARSAALKEARARIASLLSEPLKQAA